MNQPTPPPPSERHEPLGAEERRLADIHRSLRDEDPSAALDQQVLSRARLAVHGASPRRRAWRWGAGTAAGALIAVVALWQLGDPLLRGRGPAMDGYDTQLPRPQATEPAVDTAAPAPPPAPAAVSEALRAPQDAQTAESLRPQRATRAEESAQRQRRATDDAAAAQAPADSDEVRVTGARVRSDGAARQSRSEAETAGRAPQPFAAPTAPAADAGAGAVFTSPEAWLEHLALLLEQGRIEEARAGTEAFRARHPDYPVPRELQRLVDDE